MFLDVKNDVANSQEPQGKVPEKSGDSGVSVASGTPVFHLELADLSDEGETGRNAQGRGDYVRMLTQ